MKLKRWLWDDVGGVHVIPLSERENFLEGQQRKLLEEIDQAVNKLAVDLDLCEKRRAPSSRVYRK